MSQASAVSDPTLRGHRFGCRQAQAVYRWHAGLPGDILPGAGNTADAGFAGERSMMVCFDKVPFAAHASQACADVL